MPDLLAIKTTAMQPADVMVRAVQFFTAEKWRVQSQNGFIAVFVGMPRLHWLHACLDILLALFLVLPGIAYCAMAIRRNRRQQSIAVITKSVGQRCQVLVSYPADTKKLMTEFLADLV